MEDKYTLERRNGKAVLLWLNLIGQSASQMASSGSEKFWNDIGSFKYCVLY